MVLNEFKKCIAIGKCLMKVWFQLACIQIWVDNITEFLDNNWLIFNSNCVLEHLKNSHYKEEIGRKINILFISFSLKFV